jgi:hypothetical protein
MAPVLVKHYAIDDGVLDSLSLCHQPAPAAWKVVADFGALR